MARIMNNKQTKNGVNTLSPQEEKKEKILQSLELWRQMLPLYADYPSLEKEKVEAQEFISKLERELKRLEQEKEKTFSIKNFLLEKSCLVQFQKKEAVGQSLSKAEQAKEKRIYDLRDKVFANMQKELAKYYQAVIQGNYHLDGFPEISGGIKAWAEKKIWRLLARLGEPDCFPYNDKYEGFWDAKDQK